MRLNEKVAIITGAGSGIGLATVRKFVAEGARVVAADIDTRSLSTLFRDDENVFVQRGDVTVKEDTIALVDAAVQRYGCIDILVNSAGITSRSVGEGADLESKWDAVINVNVKGTMLMSHAAVEVMRINDGGAIVNIASVMGLVGYPTALPFSDGFNPYPASKGAIVQLTRDMGVRLARENVRVNAVCPGFIYTPLTESVTQNDDTHQAMRELHPMGRLGSAEEVANVVAFLSSDEASFVTGGIWTVDGGYTAE